ncbi:helix-turn-helix transcriptional regulator [Spirillospora sp. NPDC047279]|uniref:helix-turn-helix transcriptional regulator n=1 Tax=Spirillospora sp. NPDC047279 TaxID=3155478 RepID=UPI003406F805
MAKKISPARRREIEREASAIRLDGIRRGLTVEETVTRILEAVPEVLALEAWRFANGWTRTEVSARLDNHYEQEGLEPPHLSAADICRWEHGERRPGDERIEYFCRLYRTRPDRLGFGTDHSRTDMDHLRRTGILDAFPYTSTESEEDLAERVRNARQRINMFGLTRNFYGREAMLSLFEERARAMPVRIFVMDPFCDSRKDRYRIEPSEAAMEDPGRYVREILRPLYGVAQRERNFRVFLYNFPCSFAIEEIDDAVRVMLYGHGKRGTQGPILVFGGETSTQNFFVDQIRWLERLSEGETPEPWASKGISVRPLEL